MDRNLLRWLCLVVGLVLALVWLLAGTGVIGSIPGWMPPSSVVALAVAGVLGGLP